MPTNKISTKSVVTYVRHYLKQYSPSGYSFVVPADGVLFVCDGENQTHARWYVAVKTQPQHVMDTRADEVAQILRKVELQLHQKHNVTVYLTSMLPVI